MTRPNPNLQINETERNAKTTKSIKISGERRQRLMQSTISGLFSSLLQAKFNGRGFVLLPLANRAEQRTFSRPSRTNM